MANGFGPRVRARRLLRQSAGLMPPSDVQPVSGRAPAVEALLNLQLAQGLITRERFKAAVAPPPRAGATRAASRRARAPAGFFGSVRQQPVRRVRRRRPQESLLPVTVPSIGGRLMGTPTDSVRRRLIDMRRRLTRGL